MGLHMHRQGLKAKLITAGEEQELFMPVFLA